MQSRNNVIHGYEVHGYEVHGYEVHSYEVHSYEVHGSVAIQILRQGDKGL